MILEKIPINCDLTEAGLEIAEKRCFGDKTKLILYVSPGLIDQAERLKLNYKVDTTLATDAWYLVGEWSGVFSPGA